MEFYDEEILRTRNRIRAEEKAEREKETAIQKIHPSIYDQAVQLSKDSVSFQKRLILNGLAAIYMPTNFCKQSEEEVRQVFSRGNPPQEVYGNPDVEFSIAFRYTSHKIAQDELSDFMNFAEHTLRQIGSSVRILQADFKRWEQENMGILEVQVNTAQSIKNCYIFYVLLREYLTIGTIFFEDVSRDELLPLAEEIAESLQLCEGEEKK